MLHPDVEVRPSPIQGVGLFAKRFIPRGTVVWKNGAEEQRLTRAQFEAIPLEQRRLVHQQGDAYFMSRDGSQHMNHSCDPTLTHADDDTLIALRDLQPGEELTYDYATCELEDELGVNWACNCGGPTCRQHVTNRDCLDPVFQKRYQGQLPSWTIAFIAQHQRAGA
jgi:SET domain-containing protein